MIRRYASGRVRFIVTDNSGVLLVRAYGPSVEVECPAADYQGLPWDVPNDGYADLGAWLCAGVLSCWPDLAAAAEWNDADTRFVISAGGVLEQRLTARKAAP